MQDRHGGLTAALALAVVLAACTPGTIAPGDETGPSARGGSPTPNAGGWGAGGAGGSSGASQDAGTAAPTPPMIVRLDPPSGGFTGTRTVTLTPPMPGLVVRYTVDGAQPTRASPVYKGPFTLKESAVVRTFAERAGGLDTASTAGVYLRIDADAVDFTSNLPLVVLHTHGTGALPINEAPYQAGSATVIEPQNGRAALVGAVGASARAGLRVHGNSSRAFPQKSYAVELRQAGSDSDEDLAVLGLPTGSDFVLVAPSWIDRSLVRTALAFALSNDIGQYAPRLRFVEVFLTEKNGAVSAKDYVGVYALVEKIGRGKDRVAVEPLSDEAQKAPAITGGYIFRTDHDAEDFRIEHAMKDFGTSSTAFGFVYPDQEQFTRPERQAQRAYLQNYMQELVDALARPDFKNPRTGLHYSQYLDVPSFIDNNLLNALLKNVDAFRFSSYFSKDRDKPVKAGPLWDVDRSSGTPWDDFGRAENPREWAPLDVANPLTYHWWGRLLSDPAFKAAYVKRWKQLAPGGEFSPARIGLMIDKLAAEIGEAQKRHLARWPEMAPKNNDYNAELQLMKDWFGQRIVFMRAQIEQ